MGGKALKSINTHRLDAKQYHALVPQVLGIIRRIVGDKRRISEIQAYRSKIDFGDMDILIESDGLSHDYKDKLEKALGSREVYRNGGVTSFDFYGFQIDVIAIENKKFEYAQSYFAWNDLGNLIGRIAHEMGLKHGFEGLYLPLREGTNVFAKINITQRANEALTFLGYDPLRFQKGFDTLEDIFRFAASTPYFNPSIYLFENRNATSRIRDTKRKTYSEFLDWLDKPDGYQKFKNEQGLTHKAEYIFPEDKSVWIEEIKTNFPDARVRIDDAMVRKERSESAKLIFNGENVSKLTGLSGQALGHLMRELRCRFGSHDDQVDWVLSAGQSRVDAEVMRVAAMYAFPMPKDDDAELPAPRN